MTNKDNGGPAFPFGQTSEHNGQLVNGWGSEGMTLRDYYKAHAPFTASCANASLNLGNPFAEKKSFPMEMIIKELVRLRSEYADAMLLERAK